MKRIIAVGMTAMDTVCAEAKVATGVPFSDGMVLQRGRAVYKSRRLTIFVK